jgi:hypothetical protein
MKKQQFVFLATISIGFTLICMDQPDNQFSLDLTSAQLPHFTKLHNINFEDVREGFKVLTANRAIILKSLVGKEQAGRYCPDLCQAEKLLNKVIVVYPEVDNCCFKSDFLGEELVSDDETMSFLSHVAKKSMERSYLMRGLKSDYPEACLEALKNNYVVNAYGSFKPYEGRIITPLHHVLCQASQGLIDHTYYAEYYTKMLLRCRANSNARDDFDNTPMHHASTPELVGLLLEYGAKYDEYGYEMRTPLHNHIRIKNWDVVRCLLNLSVDVNVEDDYGDTPLLEAIEQDAPADIIELLLAKGASCDIFKNSQTVIHMAQDKPEILSVLESFLQQRLCKAIEDNNGDDVIGVLEIYPINLVINGIHILDWANEFYKDSLGTKVMNVLLNGNPFTLYGLNEASSPEMAKMFEQALNK